ncbi:MAG: hypothetical protein WCL32_18410 [Planctomycetota bacterium]|jgi:hypothetical protein
MMFPLAKPQRSVGRLGAEANAILRGTGEHNRGLVVRASQPQARGHEGPIQGSFVILEAGDNRHSDTLSGLLNREITAQEVLKLIRSKHPACVNVVNANSLTTDEPAPVAPPNPKT